MRPEAGALKTSCPGDWSCLELGRIKSKKVQFVEGPCKQWRKLTNTLTLGSFAVEQTFDPPRSATVKPVCHEVSSLHMVVISV